MSKRALLINPPVYDVQYWPEWSQPHGLLKVGSYLKKAGYETRLVDCLFPDPRRRVRKKIQSVVEFCSTRSIPYEEFRQHQNRLKSNQRFKYVFGLNLDDLAQILLSMAGIVETSSDSSDPIWTANMFPEFYPDEIWITSIMTYWWESTVDVAGLCKQILPSARILIGGIYPTLAPDHLQHKLADRGLGFDKALGCELDLADSRNLIVVGEIPEASWEDLDLDLYYEPDASESRYYHGPRPGDTTYRDTSAIEKQNYGPTYAILTTTRGCPFDCAYCAQHAYNLYDNRTVQEKVWTQEGKKRTVRTRGVCRTLKEIQDKFHNYGIRQFAFYEDNFLISKEHFVGVLEGIVNDPALHGNIHLHAPEGIEVRLIDSSLAKLMREAGFERVYLPLESINTEVIKSWNRSHSNVQVFERAVDNCVEAGFVLRNMQINAFLLFGTPSEDIRDVVDSVFFVSSRVGSVIPMLFTPVPGSRLFQEYAGYLREEMGFDFQHLNGKMFPFLKFNQQQSPALSIEDYLDLEALMFRVNAHAARGIFDIAGSSRVSRAFRKAISSDRSDL